MAAREWSEPDIRQLIVQRFIASTTKQQLKESVKVLDDGTNAGFIDTMRNLEVQAFQIVIQEREMKIMRDEVSRMLEDSRSFV